MTPLNKSLLESVKKHESEGLQKEKTLLSNLSAFDCELKDVYEARRPTSTDYDKRRDLIRVFNEIARELYGNNDKCPVVEEFGSFLMDMFDARSDLDLSISSGDRTGLASRSMQTETLRKFAKKLYKLRDQGHVRNVKPILSARVPVLKVTDCGSGVECDLSVGNLDGIAKSQIVLFVSSIDERFQKLCFLMKAWAKAQNINSAADGTLNSLSLILLSAFHLQTRDTPILPPFSAILKDATDLVTVKKNIHSFMKYGENNKESLAELFVSLLIKLVSVNTFWSEGLCVSTFEGSWIQKIWNRKDGPLLGCISIEDFTNRSQNASRVLKSLETHIQIYSRIHSSLDQIRLFTEGRLDAVNLKHLLFGEHPSATIRVTTHVNHATNHTQKKRKQPNEKKEQAPPGGSEKGQNIISTTGRKAKAQKTLSGSHPTQSIEGGQSEALQPTEKKKKKKKKQPPPGGSEKGKNVISTTGRKGKAQKTLSGSHPTQSIEGGQSEALQPTEKKKKKKKKQPPPGGSEKGTNIISTTGRKAKSQKTLSGSHPTQSFEGGQSEALQPNEKKKKQPPPGGSRKGKNVISTPGRKAKSQKTLSGSHPTQSFQGGQSEALNLTAPTRLAGQLVSMSNPSSQKTLIGPHPTQSFQGGQSEALNLAALTRLAVQLVSMSNPSTQGYGGIRPETHHVAPSFMPGQPRSVSNPSFQDSGRFVHHAQNLGHAGPTFMAGQPHHGPGRYEPERAHVTHSSFQGHGGFQPPRTHTESCSHGGTNIPVSHQPSLSDLPNQSYRGYRMEATRVEDFRHGNSWDSRSYNNSMPTNHHPYGPSPHHVDPERWERSYTPRPSFPLGPSPHHVDQRSYTPRPSFSLGPSQYSMDVDQRSYTPRPSFSLGPSQYSMDVDQRSYTPRPSFSLGPSQYSMDAREFENRRRF